MDKRHFGMYRRFIAVDRAVRNQALAAIEAGKRGVRLQLDSEELARRAFNDATKFLRLYDELAAEEAL